MKIPVREIRKFNVNSIKQKENLNDNKIQNIKKIPPNSNINIGVQNSFYNSFNNNINDMNNYNIPCNNNIINQMNIEFIFQNLMNPPVYNMYNNDYNNMINEIKNLFIQEIIFNQLKQVGMQYLKDTKNVNNCLLHDLNI